MRRRDAEEAGAGKDFMQRPSDIDEQMLSIASTVTGSSETGSFGIAELLPLLAENRVEDATDLLWSAFKARRFDIHDPPL